MQRLAGAATRGTADLARLEVLRLVEGAGPWTPAGAAPFLALGDVVRWRYARGCDPMRVVRDDERGLVAWLAEDTEQLVSVPADGRALRERPVVERFTAERVPAIRRWQGTGVLRIAPTGVPWSVWLFWEDDGSFAGHYVNLELTHLRSGAETSTRDLVLDLWLEPSGELWLKDADELEAATASGRFAGGLDDEVRAIADLARVHLVEAADWPLDEEWTTWRPPAHWTTPPLPDTPLVAEARRTTLPR